MILLPLLAVVAACWPTFVALHVLWTDWTNTAVTHGYLIVAICTWLLWRKREALRSAIWAPDLPGAIALVLASLAWLFVTQAGIQFVAFALLPWLLYFAARASAGASVAGAASFPIFYLYSAIPVWGVVNGFFQWASVYASRFALRMVGVPAFFEDNRVHIPEGTFEIAGGCSGLHFVVVGLSIALLLSELRGDGWRNRLKLAAIALALAVFTNWVRIFIIILAGHLSNMQNYLVARSHYGFGWLLFGVAMAVLLLIERRIPVDPRSSRHPAAPVPAGSKTSPALALLLLMAVLGGARLWHWLAVRPSTEGISLPAAPAGWQKVRSASGWSPRFAGADAEKDALYQSPDGGQVEVFIALYRSQEQGKELGGYDNDVLGGLHPGAVSAGTANGHPVLLQHAQDASGNEQLLAVTYNVGDRYFTRSATAQLWYAARSLAGLRSPPSRVVLLRSACRPDCEAAANRLQEIKD
jgi:exosortase